jgi:Domain of unknown function (DUF4129)
VVRAAASVPAVSPPASAFAAGSGGGIPNTGRGAAGRLARQELSKPIYHPHPGLLERIYLFFDHALHRLFDDAQSTIPGGWWGLIAVAVLVVLVVAVVLARVGPVARTRRRKGEPLAGDASLTARDHREAAARLAAEGDFGAAICESVRATAAELEERGVLQPRLGRTADEFAYEAGQALPSHAAGLRVAALAFDAVCYGKRAGTRAGYERARELDNQIKASAGRLERAAAEPSMAGGPVP